MWPRLLSGAVLGFPLSAVLCGLLAYIPPGNWQSLWVPALLLFFPCWIVLTGWALAQRPKKTLIWLGSANAILIPLFLSLKHFHLVG
ncbi:MAG: hypothetical protein PHV54_10495 [Tolumonas sp.]|nr:hypothetical protein [Tolumonas sp.]MDD2841595.1 hypothetical protein [Tolumonas sp.]